MLNVNHILWYFPLLLISLFYFAGFKSLNKLFLSLPAQPIHRSTCCTCTETKATSGNKRKSASSTNRLPEQRSVSLLLEHVVGITPETSLLTTCSSTTVISRTLLQAAKGSSQNVTTSRWFIPLWDLSGATVHLNMAFVTGTTLQWPICLGICARERLAARGLGLAVTTQQVGSLASRVDRSLSAWPISSQEKENQANQQSGKGGVRRTPKKRHLLRARQPGLSLYFQMSLLKLERIVFVYIWGSD